MMPNQVISTAAVGGTRRRGAGLTGTRRARGGWVLLETVIATGMLVVGLAVIGAQVQQADKTLKEMRLRLQAMMLAELQLAQLDLGLVELDSVDPIQEGDFGPRYPDFGWRLTIEETAREAVFLLKLEVLHLRRDGDYEPDSFEHDWSQSLHTVYAMRMAPQPLDLGVDLGLDDEELVELGEKLDLLGIDGLSVDALDPTILATLNFEDFLEVLPLIADAFGLDVSELLASLPPDLLEVIKDTGLLDEPASGEDEEAPAGADEER